jgi:hypothetical protein
MDRISGRPVATSVTRTDFHFSPTNKDECSETLLSGFPVTIIVDGKFLLLVTVNTSTNKCT